MKIIKKTARAVAMGSVLGVLGLTIPVAMAHHSLPTGTPDIPMPSASLPDVGGGDQSEPDREVNNPNRSQI